jgi:RNA recognition motif-containing protein
VGDVVEVFLPTERETGRPRGFAFVEFQTSDSVSAAIKKLDGHELDGRNIRVSEAQERRRGPGGPPGGGGGGGPRRSFAPRDSGGGGGGGGDSQWREPSYEGGGGGGGGGGGRGGGGGGGGGGRGRPSGKGSRRSIRRSKREL